MQVDVAGYPTFFDREMDSSTPTLQQLTNTPVREEAKACFRVIASSARFTDKHDERTQSNQLTSMASTLNCSENCCREHVGEKGENMRVEKVRRAMTAVTVCR